MSWGEWVVQSIIVILVSYNNYLMSVTLLDLKNPTIDLTGVLPAFTCSICLNFG